MHRRSIPPSRLAPWICAVFSTVSALWATPARAFLVPGEHAVAEFYNVYLGHYFMTLDSDEIQGIEAGNAGPGWVRTGFGFKACRYLQDCKGPGLATVQRFYGTPGLGPNSHFYTADPAEAAILDRPGTGWTYEGAAFFIATPSAPGACTTGVPVYRLYNNRWRFNDSNHRYVTSDAERARMVAKGWTDEGVRFCSAGALELPIASFTVDRPTFDGYIRNGVGCGDERLNLGPCISASNLAVPAARFVSSSPAPTDFFERTGMSSSSTYVVDSSQPAATAAADVFFQHDQGTLGIHIDTRHKGPNALSSLDPLYQLHVSAAQGGPDLRFFPFGAYESDVQLAMSFTLNVKTIQVRSAGGAAYGQPVIEFVDQRSGRHLYFLVLAYGTLPIADYLAPDTQTGTTIVGTTFRTDSPYARSFGLPTLPTPSGFQSPNFWGWGGRFEFRMDRAEFQRVLEVARTVDAALSAGPADYFIDNFGFNNEVFGDGEIGVNLADFKLELVRR